MLVTVKAVRDADGSISGKLFLTSQIARAEAKLSQTS